MTTATFAKEITFDRIVKEFCVVVDGEFIGYAASRREADAMADQVVYDRLIHGDHRTALDLDGGQDDDYTSPAEFIEYNSDPGDYDDLPTDGEGGDCGDHGPHGEPECPKCE